MSCICHHQMVFECAWEYLILFCLLIRLFWYIFRMLRNGVKLLLLNKYCICHTKNGIWSLSKSICIFNKLSWAFNPGIASCVFTHMIILYTVVQYVFFVHNKSCSLHMFRKRCLWWRWFIFYMERSICGQGSVKLSTINQIYKSQGLLCIMNIIFG